MSYNITNVQILASAGFGIRVAALQALLAEREEEDNWPELCLHEDDPLMKHLTVEVVKVAHPGAFLPLKRFFFSGEGSGAAFGAGLLKRILSRTEGSVDLVLTWAGGGAYTGIRSQNGRVTEHDVLTVLGPERSP